MKRALITGVTGQDGSYLAQLLLKKGYEVHGIVRRVASENPAHRLWRLKGFVERIRLHAASMENYASIFSVIEKTRPHECYHLAAQSFVAHSFEDAFSTFNANINGTLHVLSALKEKAPGCRYYFAATSEMFGMAEETPQTEQTPFRPRSPYGISKVAGFDLTRNYRESYGMFACSGILFNHESPRRGMEFVTRKITSHAARIKLGLETELRLGNLDSRRDWGYADDYVDAMWRMLQQETPEDFVIATGESHSVKEFLQAAFDCVDLNWKDYVVIDKRFYRPADVHLLTGDGTKAREKLGWEPKVKFNDLVGLMIKADLENEGRQLPGGSRPPGRGVK